MRSHREQPVKGNCITSSMTIFLVSMAVTVRLLNAGSFGCSIPANYPKLHVQELATEGCDGFPQRCNPPVFSCSRMGVALASSTNAPIESRNLLVSAWSRFTS